MLVDFLFELRREGLKVASHEWLALAEAMELGLHDSSLDGFYRLARTVCVKDVADYDAFDRAFARYFQGVTEAALALCSRPQAALSGRVALSLPLLRELGLPVMGLDGRAPLPDFHT